MKDNKLIISKDMFVKLKEELRKLLESRKELNKNLEHARQSDVSEDTDSIAAVTDEISKINMKVEDIEETLEHATVMEKKGKKTCVDIGSVVKVKTNGKTQEFTVVSDVEANPLERKISDKSPLGKQLMNGKKGKKVVVKTEDGDVEYEIVEVS